MTDDALTSDGVRVGSEVTDPVTEMHRLDRLINELDWLDPERAKIVEQYNALCDEMAIPSGDKDSADDAFDRQWTSAVAAGRCPICAIGMTHTASRCPDVTPLPIAHESPTVNP